MTVRSFEPQPPRAVAVLAGSLQRAEQIAQACRDRGLAVTALTVLDDWRSVLATVHVEAIAVDGATLKNAWDRLADVGQLPVPMLFCPIEPADSANVIANRLCGVLDALEPSGWHGDVFRLERLTVDRRGRVAHLDGHMLVLSQMLFDVLLELCEAWSCEARAPLVQADYDDIRRIKGVLGEYCDLIVTVRGRGYRLAKNLAEAKALSSGSGKHRSRRQ